MGRIADLCVEIAAAADDTPEGSYLPPEAWEKLRHDWSDADIEDAMSLVNTAQALEDLVQIADSLSVHLVELLGRWGESKGWKQAAAGQATLSLDEIRQIAHRLDRLEQLLEKQREQKGPERRGFDRLQRRLMDFGIEEEMQPEPEPRGEDEPPRETPPAVRGRRRDRPARTP